MNTHLIKILDREISVKSSESKEFVAQVESFINERLFTIKDSLKRDDRDLVFILCLLNITEELLKSTSNKDLNERLEKLLSKLNP